MAFYARGYLARRDLPADALAVEATFEVGATPARAAGIGLRLIAADPVPVERLDALLAGATHCAVHNALTSQPEVTITLVGNDISGAMNDRDSCCAYQMATLRVQLRGQPPDKSCCGAVLASVPGPRRLGGDHLQCRGLSRAGFGRLDGLKRSDRARRWPSQTCWAGLASRDRLTSAALQ